LDPAPDRTTASSTMGASGYYNLIEEIASLGKRERQELRNRLGVLLGHLLKWHYQPEALRRVGFTRLNRNL